MTADKLKDRRFVVRSGRKDGTWMALSLFQYVLYITIAVIGFGLVIGLSLWPHLSGVGPLGNFALMALIIFGTVMTMNVVAASGLATAEPERPIDNKTPLPFMFFVVLLIAGGSAIMIIYGLVAGGGVRSIFVGIFAAAACGIALIFRRQKNLYSRKSSLEPKE